MSIHKSPRPNKCWLYEQYDIEYKIVKNKDGFIHCKRDINKNYYIECLWKIDIENGNIYVYIDKINNEDIWEIYKNDEYSIIILHE